jgi:large subunit ribosomal protein L9
MPPQPKATALSPQSQTIMLPHEMDTPEKNGPFDRVPPFWYNRSYRALYPSPLSAQCGAQTLLKGLGKMRVLLLQDVFKLGRAGDVKRVADGFGRNYLIPQGLATLATPGALKQAEHIKKVAAEQRAVLNKELGAVAERIEGLELFFSVKAGETGRLYGSVTNAMIADAIMEKSGVELQAELEAMEAEAALEQEDQETDLPEEEAALEMIETEAAAPLEVEDTSQEEISEEG